MSDCLWPGGLQHARLACPPPAHGAYSNSCPSSLWCQPTFSSSVVPFSSRLQSFPASGSCPMSQSFTLSIVFPSIYHEAMGLFIGTTEAEAETPILWPPHAKSWLIGKDPDAGRDWGQEEKGTTEDEIAGWQSPTRWTWVWVNSRSWWWAGRPGMLRFIGSQRADTTERLNWTEMNN